MNIDSDDWQVDGTIVYKLFNDRNGQRCNEFLIQISGDTEVTLKEKEDLAQTLANHLNRPVTPL